MKCLQAATSCSGVNGSERLCCCVSCWLQFLLFALFPLTNDKECKEVFERGEKNRMVESTEINEYNTRSHTILMIKIEKCYSNEEIEQNVVKKRMLYLVDLAGSERIKPYIKGKQLEQTKKINNSLSVLGNCINSIVLGNSYMRTSVKIPAIRANGAQIQCHSPIKNHGQLLLVPGCDAQPANVKIIIPKKIYGITFLNDTFIVFILIN